MQHEFMPTGVSDGLASLSLAREEQEKYYPHDSVTRAILLYLEGAENPSIHALNIVFNCLPTEQTDGYAVIYEMLAPRILKLGEPLLACDVIDQGLERWPDNLRLRQMKALALARSGATEHAQEQLTRLRDEGNVDGETLGILARTYKDLWKHGKDSIEKPRCLEQACRIYQEAFSRAKQGKRLDEAIYTGINAATTSLLIGRARQAAALAREVYALADRKLQQQDEYWALVTQGEAALILGEWNEAEDKYGRGAQLASGNYGDQSSTRRQAKLLLRHLERDVNSMDRCFKIPTIVVFAGHMIDQPGRPTPRFPQSLETAVSRALADKLKRIDDKIGYSGAACGSDIIFLEEMLRQNSGTNVILPFPEEEFVEASVDIIPGANWKERHEIVMEQVSRVIVADQHHVAGSSVCYEYSNLIQFGLAILRAQMLDARLLPLTVWDGKTGDGPGGTYSLVGHWRDQGFEPEIINTTALLKSSVTVTTGRSDVTPRRKAGAVRYTERESHQEIMAILIADVAGYGRLTEEQKPLFAEHFMGEVAKVLEECAEPPVTRNTWGDSLYFVFRTVRDAGVFALDLRERLCACDWPQKGLPRDLSLRIALNAGPVFPCTDPITGRNGYIGSHVVWAARIEPKTPKGMVYASLPFSAVAAANGVTEFTCDYVGRIDLPKHFGTFPIYHVHRNIGLGT